MENDPNCNVKIVHYGMNYFNAHKFISGAVTECGNPIEIPEELVKNIITTGLAVTVTREDYETLMVVLAARRLYAGNFAQFLLLPLVVEINRMLVLGYQTFKDYEKVQQVKKKILKYNEF